MRKTALFSSALIIIFYNLIKQSDEKTESFENFDNSSPIANRLKFSDIWKPPADK